MLQHEVDAIEALTDKLMANEICKSLIKAGKVEYEQPGITELCGLKWKGKADVVNHDDGLVIDLKTTKDINRFRSSAFRYNYDSQAYIYSKLFGYEMLFVVIDKESGQIGLFDCSPDFYESGKDKVERASEQYKLFYQTPDFDHKQFFINKTL